MPVPGYKSHFPSPYNEQIETPIFPSHVAKSGTSMIDENKNIAEKTTIACITLICFNQLYLTTTTIIKQKYARSACGLDCLVFENDTCLCCV